MGIFIVFILYFILGLQLILKPHRFIKIEFLCCLFLSLVMFNFHSALLSKL